MSELDALFGRQPPGDKVYTWGPYCGDEAYGYNSPTSCRRKLGHTGDHARPGHLKSCEITRWPRTIPRCKNVSASGVGCDLRFDHEGDTHEAVLGGVKLTWVDASILRDTEIEALAREFIKSELSLAECLWDHITDRFFDAAYEMAERVLNHRDKWREERSKDAQGTTTPNTLDT